MLFRSPDSQAFLVGRRQRLAGICALDICGFAALSFSPSDSENLPHGDRPDFSENNMRLMTAFLLLAMSATCQAEDTANWKAGVATVAITPRQSMWMVDTPRARSPPKERCPNCTRKRSQLKTRTGREQ